MERSLEGLFVEEKAERINQALKQLKAPFYVICDPKTSHLKRKKAIWVKIIESCNGKYPLRPRTTENVVKSYLKKHFKVSLQSFIRDPEKALEKARDHKDGQLRIRREREQNKAARLKQRESREKRPAKTKRSVTRRRSAGSSENSQIDKIKRLRNLLK